MNKKLAEKIALVVGGILIGGSTTYFLVRKDVETRYREIAEAEIESVKDSYNLLHKQGPYSDPKKAFEAMRLRVQETETYETLLDENGYFKEEELDKNEEPKPNTVRRPPLPDGRPDPEDVVEAIEDTRADPPRHEGTTLPYVITINEFMQDNPEYDKTTVSYYEYDNTLASDDDSMVKDHEKLIGVDFLNYVGWKSDSDHIVYVRNEKLSSDFEILVHESGYEEAVLGIIPEGHPKKTMLNAKNNE